MCQRNPFAASPFRTRQWLGQSMLDRPHELVAGIRKIDKVPEFTERNHRSGDNGYALQEIIKNLEWHTMQVLFVKTIVRHHADIKASRKSRYPLCSYPWDAVSIR